VEKLLLTMRYSQDENRMRFPSAVAKQPQINAAVSEVVRLLTPDVVHIRYDIGQDWSGDWAIFFRVLLSDEASRTRLVRPLPLRNDAVDHYQLKSDRSQAPICRCRPGHSAQGAKLMILVPRSTSRETGSWEP
jgi:hypothetical protein